MPFISIGEPATIDQACSEINLIIKASKKNSDFELVEVRTSTVAGDTAIFDCTSQEIGNKNAVGISCRERLAIIFAPSADGGFPYSIRALRSGFPLTMHQNSVQEGAPPSLCMYLEPWEAVERTWTPEAFLKRIHWWLVTASRKGFQTKSQPIEQLYFKSPISVVLPRKLGREGELSFLLDASALFPAKGKDCFIRCSEGNFDPLHACHVIEAPSVPEGPILPMPYTLGALENQLQDRGSRFIDKFLQLIKSGIPQDGLDRTNKPNYWTGHTLLILRIPIRRMPEGEPGRIEQKGFLTDSGILEIGAAGGVLSTIDKNRYYKNYSIGQKETTAPNNWKAITIWPVEVLEPLDRKDAQLISALEEEESEINGMIAGVGALGSNLVQIWARECWGIWTLVDDDHIRPHNLARHITDDTAVGFPKAEVVTATINNIYPSHSEKHKAVVAKANTYLAQEFATRPIPFDIIVDTTTTLGFPRDLSNISSAKRAASAFITPTGMGSVLLLEDTDRRIRLDSLEAQYYRHIITSTWGEKHLEGNLSQISVGASCRDISMALSSEVIELHSAILARQIRKRVSMPEASIVVYDLDDTNGSVNAHILEIQDTMRIHSGDWEILLDSGIANKSFELRENSLPNETGGIIVGYHDLKMRRMTIVDILPEPKDSSTSTDFFIRGRAGALEEVLEIRRRTAEVVDYIGEWHSHTGGFPCIPSEIDLKAIESMDTEAKEDGLPFLMLIVGEGSLCPIITSK
jgi:hypothetical protein